jgi:protein-tyrosine kinase
MLGARFRGEHVGGLPVGRGVLPSAVVHSTAYATLAANVWARYEAGSMKVLLFIDTEGKKDGSGCVARDFSAFLAVERGGPVLMMGLREAPGTRSIEGGKDAGLDLWRLVAAGAALQAPPVDGPPLYLLFGGTGNASRRKLLHSDACHRFLETVRDLFQVVIVDAPSPAVHPETLLLCRKVDGVILVLQSERTRKQLALWTVRQIEEAGGRVIGTVLNGCRYRIPGWIYRRL